MKHQVWFCNLCEEEFTVSDVPRETVRCTGGHPHGWTGKLTADHWPLEAEYRRTESVAEVEADAEPWETVVLEEGKRFSPSESAARADREAQARTDRVASELGQDGRTRGGWCQ